VAELKLDNGSPERPKRTDDVTRAANRLLTESG
jgi:hypothetical protein